MPDSPSSPPFSSPPVFSLALRPNARALLGAALALLGAMACTGKNPAETIYVPVLAPSAPYVDGELVVRFPAGTTRAEVEARVSPWGGFVLDAMIDDEAGLAGDASTVEYLDGLVRLGLPGHLGVEDALGLLAYEGLSLYAEPNYIVNAIKTPNDPRYGELWGMARIDAPGAWERGTGSANVVVAVIDTGLDYTHPDLVNRAWRNPGETAGNGLDDDHNGYVDDIYGWDFCNNDSNPMDDHGHGTHCAGTITGQGDNGVGVAGVTWNSRVMGLKFLCANGSGNTFAAALAVRYAADMNVTLTSNSWGGGGFSQMLYDTILYAQSRDQLFVAAAGNDGLNIDATNSYPAGYDLPNIVTVAASDAADARAGFSNYGATRVDLAAPGVGILSTLPGNKYAAWSGTSMATPHVSGALALYYAAHPDATWSDARAALLGAVDPIAAWQGVVATGGRLNVGRLLAGAAPPPPAPASVQVAADGPDGLKVSWAPPGDPTVTHYLMYARVDGGAVRAAQRADTSPARIGPVGIGVWHVSVAAVSPNGEGPRSAEATLILTDLVPPGRILDLAVRAPTGAPVDALGVVATTDFGLGWEASRTVDGDPLTGWAARPASAPDDARLWLDLPAHTRIGRLSVAGLPGFEAFFPPGLEVRALSAGEWTVVASELEATDAAAWSWDLAPFDAERLEVHVTEFASHESGLQYAVLGEIGLYAPPVDPTSLDLAFTAPGDDDASGQATEYDVRVAEGLTVEGFAAAPRFPVAGPAPAGQREQRTVGGLPSRKTLGVSVAAVDERGQRGAPSPVVFATTGAVPPGAPRDLVVVETGAVETGLDFVELRWVAPADDGDDARTGAVAAYEIRWSDRPITSATWPEARRIDGPVPAAPGAVQTFRVANLPASPRHHLRLAALDHAGLRGPWSGDVGADSPAGPDHTPPARVGTLTALYEAGGTEPLPLAGEAALVDGDPDTGWMQDGAAGETLSLAFSVGPTPRALTRVVLQPHALWPGDLPVAAVLRTFEPANGLWTERARVDSVVPGAPLVLGMAPVDVTGFTLDLTVSAPRFGVSVAALGEVEAELALPGGGRGRLTWVAPGDDAFLGRAVEYDLRRAETAIDSEAAFSAATRLDIPAPAEGGALEVSTLPGLGDAPTLFFSLRARDDAGAWGPLGNTARLDLPPIPPAAVRDLRVIGVEHTAVVLAFTAPGDDGDTGRATRYDLRRVEGAMTPARFTTATPVPTPAPAPAGTAEQVRVEGLSPGTAYGFGLVAVDELDAVGALGAPVAVTTLEATPPANVADLRVEAGPAPDRVVLRWTAPGDDGAAGRARRYVLKVSESPLTPANFAAAQGVATAAPQLAGSAEVATAGGLAAERTFYFAVMTEDDAGNVSGLSNVARFDTPATPPAAIADLHVVGREAAALSVAFTAPGDDGALGQAAAYDLRWSRLPIVSEADFLAATRVETTAPRPAGGAESMRVGGLPEGTRVHLCILARDERGAASPRSPDVTGDTLDRTAPARVVDLSGSAVAAATALTPVYAAASSALMAQTGAAGVIDENPSSVWLSALHDEPAPEWLVLDLGTPIAIDRLILRPAPGYAAQFPAGLRVDSSLGEPGDDDTTLLLDERGLTVPEDGALERRFAPVSVRWLRLFTPTGMPFGEQGLVAVGAVEVFAADAGLRSVSLAFTAPADVGPTGRVQAYDVRVATNLVEPATPAVFDAARALGGPIAQPAGLPQAFTATGLLPETRYGFALIATDADGNRSPISNVATVTTRGVPPTTIVDLRADAPEETALTLRFTAPGDAGAPAARYELRRSTTALNAENFALATLLPTPVPALPGTAESVRVTGLTASTTLYFAVRSADAAGDASALSNVLVVRTADPPERVPPARILDLRATTAADADGAVTLAFTAPGDDALVGRATRYDLRWSLAPIGAANFEQATPFATAAPLPGGAAEQRTVTGLPGERTVHFAVRAVDDVGNVGGLSNPASAPTRPIPPSTIADLRIVRDGTAAVLRFTAPGADRNVGRATRYELFVETRPFVSVQGLTPRADAPVPQPAGTAEVFSIAARPVDSTTYAAVRAVDDVGNAGDLSPVVSVVFPDTVAPARPEAVSLATGMERGTLRLRFQAPGDDAFSGTATRFEVAWAEAAFAPFAAGTPYAGFLSVTPGGGDADLILRGLPDERPLFVSVRAVDNAQQVGPASEVVSARTPDVAPERVSDLRATAAGPDAIALAWSAPGDDGLLGRATRYEVRRADAMLTEANWAAATVVAGAPAPADPRTAQTLRATGLRDGRAYFFALRTTDDRGNVSALSNSASATTEDTTAPAAVADLRVEGEPGRPDALRLHWTAAGDDGGVGTARRVDVRVFAGAWPGWLGAVLVPFNFSPGAAGTAQSGVIGGLSPETRYLVSLASVDEVGNAAQPSNVAAATTGDVPPGAPTRLAAAPDGPGALRLAWVAPADNGADVSSGPVARYELAVADHEVATFDGLAVRPGPAVLAPGDTQTFRLTGLADDTPFWVLVRAVDDAGNVGPAAPAVTAATPDVAAPARVVTLVAQPPRTDADALITGAAQASATLSAAWPADAAFDGDPDSAWAAPPAADGQPPRLTVALDGRPRVGGLRLWVGAWPDQFPTAFDLSLDGSVVAHFEGLEPVADQWIELAFEPDAAASLSLSITEVGDPDGYVVVPEVEVLPADDPPDSLLLSWVAPGDNADRGTAKRYDLRVSERPIDAANFAAAQVVATPVPAPAGRPQSLRVSGLSEDTAYHFALVTLDDAGNTSPVSNDATARTGGVPPDVVDDLVATADGAGAVVLEWSAPDDEAGVAAYDLRYRPGALGDPSWAQAARAVTPAPAAPGTRQRVRLDGLLPGTGYAFGLRSTDTRGFTSRTSNLAYVLTAPGADLLNPSAVTELRAHAVAGDGRALAVERVTASGAQFPALPPAATVDGDPETAWATPVAAGPGEEFIAFTLPAPLAIDRIRLRAAPDLADLFPRDFVVEVALDGQNFVPVVTVADFVADPARAASFDFEPTPVRDLRIRAQRPHRADHWLVVLAEVELFEAAASDAVTLTFVAPGDDGDVGRATSYRVGRAAAPLTEGGWAAAAVVEADLEPLPAGAPQAIVLTGLPPGRHHFAVRAVDEVGHLGPVGASVVFDVR